MRSAVKRMQETAVPAPGFVADPSLTDIKKMRERLKQHYPDYVAIERALRFKHEFLEQDGTSCPGAVLCGGGRTFAINTEPQLRAAYITTGKVRFIFQNFAFLGVESDWAAQAAECAVAEGRFVEYHDRLFAAQRGENSGSSEKSEFASRQAV